ncbi:NAC domain containing protein 86 [Euphorbia peplus]|nr:NAC domain containing protein 86 [Euphorbia peplus]
MNLINFEKKCPVGFRFIPNDEEIINHYLNHKINGRNDLVDPLINEIDLLKCHPRDIPALSKASSSSRDDHDKRWFFFNQPHFKSLNSKRSNRRTKWGFWKATGKVRVIKVRGEAIGGKRSLVFYEESCGNKPAKTNWIIHEFQAYTGFSDESNFVLCKLKYEGDLEKSSDTGSGRVLLSAPKPIHAESQEIKSRMHLKHSLSGEHLASSSREQHTQLNLQYTCDNDVADSFLDLDDWPYERDEKGSEHPENENTALNLHSTPDYDANPINLEFLDLDDWLYEEYAAN